MARFAVETPAQHARWSDILHIWEAADEIDLFAVEPLADALSRLG
jgi:hypothetical protein